MARPVIGHSGPKTNIPDRGRYQSGTHRANDPMHVPHSLRTISFLLTVILVAGACRTETAQPETAASEPAAEPAPPAVGDPAPPVRLTSNEGTPVDLADYRGEWVVLYFYPKDFTSGCTTEARNFQRDLDQYEARNAVILGVSVDDAETHADFCAKEGLHFKLLADTDGNVSASYGSVREGGERRQSTRNTFVIDPDGNVAQVYIGVNPNTHSEAVLTDLARLQGA